MKKKTLQEKIQAQTKPSQIVRMEKKYVLMIYCENNEDTIQKIIEAAATEGAGVHQAYSKVAFITKLEGNWLSALTAKPLQGRPGKETREPSALIVMSCPRREEVVQRVLQAIMDVHTWEEPVVQVFPVEEATKLLVD